MIDIPEANTISEEVRAYIERVYPEFNADTLINDNKDLFHRAEGRFSEFYSYYLEREKYNLKWAFDQAQVGFIDRDEIYHQRITEYIPNYRELMALLGRRATNRLRMLRRTFSLFSFLVQFVDIIVSVSLILVVTVLAQRIEHAIQSIALSLFFIGLIALAKVTLDRFFVIPKIDEWGWKRYLTGLGILRRLSVRRIGIRLVLEENYNRDPSGTDALELLVLAITDADSPVRITEKQVEHLLAVSKEKKE